jgi:putative ABC transport system permease protein
MGYVRLKTAIAAEGQPEDSGNRVSAGQNIVSAGYFQTMGIQIVRGRSFGVADDERSRPVAVVNQRLADMLWPGRDPIGRRFRSSGSDADWVEVVGVAKTGKYEFLFENPQAYVYLPLAQEYTTLRVLHVRASIPADALAPVVERAIRTLEPDLPLYDVQTMTRALGSGLGFFPVRVGAIAVVAFGLLSLALAIAGLYGVTSFLATQRTHEIGVRLAVGASQQQILRLVLFDSSKLAIAGVTAGLLVTLATSRIVGSFLFGVSAHDLWTIGRVVPILSSVAVIACAVPARRAARLDPTIALRSE